MRNPPIGKPFLDEIHDFTPADDEFGPPRTAAPAPKLGDRVEVRFEATFKYAYDGERKAMITQGGESYIVPTDSVTVLAPVVPPASEDPVLTCRVSPEGVVYVKVRADTWVSVRPDFADGGVGFPNKDADGWDVIAPWEAVDRTREPGE